MIENKTVKRNYDLYAYLCVNHIHNTYPIRNPQKILKELFSLREGDEISIKGIGSLEVVKVLVETYPWKSNGKEHVYEEISIACKNI